VTSKKEAERAMALTTWNMDPAHSSVEFAVKHMMFTTVRGRFKDAHATLHLDEQDPSRSWVEAEIDAASIDTGQDARDEHLRSADFLDVENHPKITFKSKRLEGAKGKEGERFRMAGDLTIRGTTMEVELDCQFEGTGTDPWGGTRAGFAAKGELDRRDWGLRWNQALETGGVLVANNVRVELEVQAVKQAEAAAETEEHAPPPG
jgi:polyisoprenoid-binding protein YceI